MTAVYGRNHPPPPRSITNMSFSDLQYFVDMRILSAVFYVDDYPDILSIRTSILDKNKHNVLLTPLRVNIVMMVDIGGKITC